MIKVNNVVKTFEGFRALDGLTMTAPENPPSCDTSLASTAPIPAASWLTASRSMKIPP